MAPIRVALIGLSASAKTSWASRAHLPYLLSPTGRSKYQIVALLNSSVDAARAAIKTYDLPASTRAYGSPSDLAADPDIDLVVCNTRVDVHYSTILPSIEAGKAVFCEWPLAQDAKHAEELVNKAREVGVLDKTVVGLQGRVGPLVDKLRGVLEEGRIGKVLSSEVRMFGGVNDRETIPKSLSYFLEREVGGNIYTIGFAHAFDTIQAVIGELEAGTGHFQLQRSLVPLTVDGKRSGQVVKSTTPDLILIAGTLTESETVAKGASFHAKLRRGQPFPGEPALVWSIHGEKGEVRLVSQDAANLQIGPGPYLIQIHDFETDKVESVDFKWEDDIQELPPMSRNIGVVYERFAAAQAGGKVAYPTFDHALKRHKQLEGFAAGWSA
ncbi:hypothetical protein OQA88_2514 [Cercophora sp. LCS_1]